MLLECTCGKMYRVRDGATNPPKTCPACGGTLRAAGSAAPAAPPPAPAPAAPAGPDPRVKDLEAKLQGLERDQAAARAAAELKEKELHEAQASIARLGSDLEKAQAAYKEALQKREERIQELEAEAAKAKGAGGGAPSAQTLQLLRAKDEALREAQEKAVALEQDLADVRQGSSKMAEDLARIETQYKAALKSKEEEVDDLTTRLKAVEKQIVETASKAQHSNEPEAVRLAAKVSSLEKIIQDGESRYRALQKQLESAGPVNDEQKEAIADRDRKIAELQAELAQARNRPSVAPLLGGATMAKAGEVRYLAADLDRGLASISTALAGLVTRVRRLHETMEENFADAPATPPPEEALGGAGAPVLEAAPLPPPSEPDAPPDLPIVEQPVDEPDAAAEDVPQLETFEAPADGPSDALPADETLLDMGGANRVKQAKVEEVPLEEAATPPPEPAPESEPEPSPGQKKGFFGKLFGKKNK